MERRRKELLKKTVEIVLSRFRFRNIAVYLSLTEPWGITFNMKYFRTTDIIQQTELKIPSVAKGLNPYWLVTCCISNAQWSPVYYS